MSSDIIPATCAETQYEQLSDDSGRLLLLPSAAVAACRAAGVHVLNLTVRLVPPDSTAETVTLSDAARLHVSDVDDLTFEQARSRIRRACESGEVVSTGERASRRIDLQSLAAWRLRERERNLNAQG